MKRDDFAEKFPGTLNGIANGHVAFVPDSLPPAIRGSRELFAANDSATLALGELRAIVPSLPNPSLLTRPFLRREAILSNRIEGTFVELAELCEYESAEATGEKHPGRKKPSQRQSFGRQIEVFNYVHALEFGLTMLDSLPICCRLLRNVHAQLLAGVRGQYDAPGQFRQQQNFIGPTNDIAQARFVPPPVEQMNEGMKNFEIYIDNPTADLPALAQIAIIHYQFEAIHPFADGNGRLGRLLISLLLSAWKLLPEPLLYLSAYFSRNRDQYVSLLWEVSRRGAWNEWIMFFLKGVRQEAVDAVNRARKLLDLREQYREQLQTQRGAAALFLLVDSLFVGPWITVPKAVDVLDMSYNGAKKNIERLLRADILDEIQTSHRTKWYFASEIMSILEAETA